MLKLFLKLIPFYFFCVTIGNSQSLYWKHSNQNNRSQGKGIHYTLDKKAFEQALQSSSSQTGRANTLIEIPDANGNIDTYQIEQIRIFSPELEKKYPQIKNYVEVSLKTKESVSILCGRHWGLMLPLLKKNNILLSKLPKKMETITECTAEQFLT